MPTRNQAWRPNQWRAQSIVCPTTVASKPVRPSVTLSDRLSVIRATEAQQYEMARREIKAREERLANNPPRFSPMIIGFGTQLSRPV